MNIFSFVALRLYSSLKNKKGEIYYHGRAHDNQTLEQVMNRHHNNQGSDGRRFDVGDSIHRTTPIGTSYETVRGIEGNGTDTTGIFGRGTGKVRGNVDPGISEKNKKKKRYIKAGKRYLKSIGVKNATELPNYRHDEF